MRGEAAVHGRPSFRSLSLSLVGDRFMVENGNRVHLPRFPLKPRNPFRPWCRGLQRVGAPSAVRNSARSLPGRGQEQPGGSGRSGSCRGDPSSRFRGSKAQRRGSPSRKPRTSGSYCIPGEGLRLPQPRPSGQRTVKSREGRSSARGPPFVGREVTLQASCPLTFPERYAVVKWVK